MVSIPEVRSCPIGKLRKSSQTVSVSEWVGNSYQNRRSLDRAIACCICIQDISQGGRYQTMKTGTYTSAA